jgi:2-aminoadipate transaminase
VLDAVGAVAVPVKTDEHGICPADLQQRLEELDRSGQLSRVRLIYVVSYFDNPSGANLAADRRQEIVRTAERWSRDQRILVLEDAAYRELDYENSRLPSIWSYDVSRSHVILAQTFSKSFSPGLRIGYGILPADLLKPITDLKGNEDFGSAHLNQQLMAHVLQSGKYTNHLASVQAGYQIRCDAMLAAADRYFSDIPGVSWIRPKGGLYVWMTLPSHLQTGFDSRLFAIATKEQKVMYVPGELAYPSGWAERPRSQMRLSFGVLSPENITEGMRRLALAVRTALQ